MHDWTGDYRAAFVLSIVLCLVSVIAIWRAAPGRVRMVAGRARARELAAAKS
jgi:hypothetical protein